MKTIDIAALIERGQRLAAALEAAFEGLPNEDVLLERYIARAEVYHWTALAAKAKADAERRKEARLAAIAEHERTGCHDWLDIMTHGDCGPRYMCSGCGAVKYS